MTTVRTQFTTRKESVKFKILAPVPFRFVFELSEHLAPTCVGDAFRKVLIFQHIDYKTKLYYDIILAMKSKIAVINNGIKRTVTNLTGQRFGKLVVESYSHSEGKIGTYWNCKCDCGKTTISTRNRLLQGKHLSCGCLKGQARIKHTVGERFNRLVVSSYKKGGFRECLCDCGNKLTTRGRDLRSGKTQSCGCWNLESSSIVGSQTGYKNCFRNSRNYDWSINHNGKTIYLRSGYEYIYALHLIRNSIDFAYEPKVFILGDGVRYIPDFFLTKENLWVEIKGKMSAQSQTKIDLFKKTAKQKIEVLFWDDLKEKLPKEMTYRKLLKSRRIC